MINGDTHEAPQRKRRVEGGGPIGCGCGMMLGLATAIPYLLDTVDISSLGIALVVVVAILGGVLGWWRGDAFFAKTGR